MLYIIYLYVIRYKTYNILELTVKASRRASYIKPMWPVRPKNVIYFVCFSTHFADDLPKAALSIFEFLQLFNVPGTWRCKNEKGQCVF